METITTSAQKERPILFNTAMVKANNALIKTQTRRIIDPQPPQNATYFGEGFDFQKGTGFVWELEPDGEIIKFWPNPEDLYCPFGQVGDLLWVRETFYAYGYWRFKNDKYSFVDETLQFGSYRFCDNPPKEIETIRSSKAGWYKRPSIHMPRQVCRTLLEITNVRPECLHEISEADAIAEGIEKIPMNSAEIEMYHCQLFKNYLFTTEEKLKVKYPEDNFLYRHYPARLSFESLWVLLNGSESWEANPWVWVIDYKIVKGDPDHAN